MPAATVSHLTLIATVAPDVLRPATRGKATVALFVTILQQLQMFIGIIINLTLYAYHNHFDNCDYDAGVVLFVLLLYWTLLLL